jgi:hypothetical protein
MRLDVLVTTFERPHRLARTLESLLQAPIPVGLSVNVTVIENNRGTDADYRRWCFWNGVSRSVIESRCPSEVVCVGKGPRYLYGTAGARPDAGLTPVPPRRSLVAIRRGTRGLASARLRAWQLFPA